jgi:Leucine-rich repeat (LRR) protein
MTNRFTLKKYFILSLFIVFCSVSSLWGQQFTDREIGFDVTRTTASLKQRGASDQDIQMQITMERDMYKKMYLEMLQQQKEVEQKIELQQKSNTNARVTLATPSELAQDKAALITLYNSTGGAAWTNTVNAQGAWPVNDPNAVVTSWNATTKTGWFGVTVGATGRVTILGLAGNKLIGNLPIQIGKLSSLYKLSLYGNQLSGTIPVEIGQLTNLSEIYLGANKLTGAIPIEITQLLNLTYLSLYSNKLSGAIPTQIGQLTKLTAIYLGDNTLTGSIPIEIGQLPNLSILSLYANQLSGVIPVEIEQLIKLTNVALYNNQLSGIIPTEIGKLINLTSLIIGDNKLSGAIPLEIVQLTKLSRLSLDTNQLSGVIPTEIGQLINLTSLLLNGNQLSGTIPIEIGKLTRLSQLWLYSNKLSGSIPKEIGQLLSLNQLDLQSNQLLGSLPIEIGKLSNLSYLMLSDNQLSGSIPKEIGLLSKLTYLRLQNNQLVGSIPIEVGQLLNLYQLALNDNQITGAIPKEIGQLSNLVQLFLSTNQLSGSIPIEIDKLSKISLINLRNNQLSGSIPDLTGLSLLKSFYIGNNQFRFVDFNTQFPLYKTNITSQFSFFQQAKIDLQETITKIAGQSVELKMCTDDRFHPEDTYQWFKNNVVITGATSRVYTLPSLTATQAGVYTCKSYHITNPNMSPLVLEREPITLKVVNCTPLIGNIVLINLSTYSCGDRNLTFGSSLLPTDATYAWEFKNPQGQVLGTSSNNEATYNFTTIGINRVSLTVTEATGCKTTFTYTVEVKDCPCTAPINLIISDYDGASATISWTETGTATAWEVGVVPYGSGLPTSSTLTTQNPYHFSYLQPSTLLEVYVRAVCSTTKKSEWLGPILLANTNNNSCPVAITITEETTCINQEMGFTFNTPTTGLTYQWYLYDKNSLLVDTGNQSIFTTVVSESAKVVMIVTDRYGNQTIQVKKFGTQNCCNQDFNITGIEEIFTESELCTNKNITFLPNYGFPNNNLTYQWSITDSSGNALSASTQENFVINTPLAGYYTIKLIATNQGGCSTIHTKSIYVKACSCTATNPKTAVVKELLNTLLNSLITRSLNGETDAQINGSNPPELTALRPYIPVGGDKIYNFVSTRNEQGLITVLQFSFSPASVYDVYISSLFYGITTNNFEINLEQYTSSSELLTSCFNTGSRTTAKGQECPERLEIRDIDFCPPACTPITSTLQIDLINPNPNGSICTQTQIAFSLSNSETLPAGLTYNWTFYDQDDTTLLEEYTNTDVVFEYSELGEYNVKLVVTDAAGCTTEFLQTITINSCEVISQSCTLTNPNTAVVKQLYINLANHLLTKIKNEGTIANGYNPIELKALAPYITDPNPRIYNATFTNGDLKYSFSTHQAGQYDVLIRDRNRRIVDVNVSSFTTAEVAGYYRLRYKTVGYESKHTVRHVNFCPDALFVSCSATNPRTERVKLMFANLINHLRTEVKAGKTIKEGYNCVELIKLKPYLLDYDDPKIYGFKAEPLSFSFHPLTTQGEYDVKLNIPTSIDSLTTADLDVYTYQNMTTYTAITYATVLDAVATNSEVRHINFCPDPICVNHVAIVVDESGSLSNLEKTKIKRQLTGFIEQQVLANETDEGNMYLSLIGLSDSDTDTRQDHVLYERITSANKNKYLTWINNYGSRYKTDGVSEGSDFWKSGLDRALATGDKKPNAVLLITDGSQTNSLSSLKATMSQFNNYGHPSVPDKNKPHLYVIGIDTGFYVYDETTANKVLLKSNDPNYNTTLKSTTSSSTERVTPSLTLSLKYLLNLVDAEFPTSDISDFTKDFYAHPSFTFLGDPINVNYLSNELKQAIKIDCGEEAASNRCDTCFSFQPEQGKTYVLNAWAKEESNVQVTEYTQPKIVLRFKNFDKNVISEMEFSTQGDIIEGWQRIWGKFEVPYLKGDISKQTAYIEFELFNKSDSAPVFFDDIRIYPIKSSMKSFVYDPETFRLMSELDENNYATYYEYDNEGGLVRVKKETAKGVKTIQETRSGNVIKE